MTSRSEKIVYLKSEDFQNIPFLKIELEKLYMGPPRNFRLEFSMKYTQPLNKIFDEIIRTNGIREVFFSFKQIELNQSEN